MVLKNGSSIPSGRVTLGIAWHLEHSTPNATTANSPSSASPAAADAIATKIPTSAGADRVASGGGSGGSCSGGGGFNGSCYGDGGSVGASVRYNLVHWGFSLITFKLSRIIPTKCSLLEILSF